MDKKNLLVDVDIDKIVKESLAKSLPKDIREAYVATPKKYSQVTEYVSQKTKTAHAELYEKTVETLNRVSAELDSADRNAANSGHSNFRSLKLDETYNLNSCWLHEMYFAGFFDPQSTVYMDSKAFIKLQETFGNFDLWQKDFIACALSCGDGWAVCGLNVFLKKYVNTVVSNHSQDVMMGLIPLIVLDMHEHAYYRDYLNDKKSYIISMMQTISWNVVEERFVKAESILQVLK